MKSRLAWCVRLGKDVIIIDRRCVENFKDPVCHGCVKFDMLKNVRR